MKTVCDVLNVSRDRGGGYPSSHKISIISDSSQAATSARYRGVASPLYSKTVVAGR